MTLQKYRVVKDLTVDESSVEEALTKLLNFDIEELIEHPQWHELLSLTLYYLYISDSSDKMKIKTMRFLLRLCLGMPGFQAVEAIIALFSYLFHSLPCIPSSSPNVFVLSPSHTNRLELMRSSLERLTERFLFILFYYFYPLITTTLDLYSCNLV